VSQYLDLGMTFVVMIGAGALGGYYLDKRFATAPWWLLIGACLGIIVGFYHFFSVVLRK
jgi:F0F1-type ATP synthase assembly protein I